MYLAWATDEDIRRRASSGGAVTALLKFALERGMVEGVVAVKQKDGDRLEGIPVLITSPEKLLETAGTLHFASPNIARFIKEYLGGAFDMRLAVVTKPCDARALVELAKREQVKRENLIIIGLNCTGTLKSSVARKMLEEEFGASPEDIIWEDIDGDTFKVRLRDGREIERSLSELEVKGYGRRENCRRCEVKIPTMADIACGKWGGEDKGATFIEILTEKGEEIFTKAKEAGYIKVEDADESSIELRRKKEEEEKSKARKCLEEDLKPLREMGLSEKFSYWMDHFNQCIKCYGCRDACPICYCVDCCLEADRFVIPPGRIPPSIAFPAIRAFHVAESCVNCGQCQDSCPADIPISKLIYMLNRELKEIFGYEPGMDLAARPPLKAVEEGEQLIPEPILTRAHLKALQAIRREA